MRGRTQAQDCAGSAMAPATALCVPQSSSCPHTGLLCAVPRSCSQNTHCGPPAQTGCCVCMSPHYRMPAEQCPTPPLLLRCQEKCSSVATYSQPLNKSSLASCRRRCHRHHRALHTHAATAAHYQADCNPARMRRCSCAPAYKK